MMDRSTKFWDRTAERYAKRPIADEAAYEKKLQVTREYFEPHMEVLELGCGTGSTAIAHAPYVKHIRAIDLSSKMLAIAQGRADAANVNNVTFEQSTVDDLRVPDQFMDAVLALSVLHLLEDREAAITKVHKMLKPGGVFVTSTACLGDVNVFIRLFISIGRFLGLIPMIKVFTTTELKNSLTGAGFEIDYEWQPKKVAGLFIVAKKVRDTSTT
jgi:ubiquinone/menaquinone biosynthesis C-methylase UbiE